MRMNPTASSVLVASVMGVATLALWATQASAQRPAAGPIGEARLLSGAEWAIGQWEGEVLTFGSSAGSAGLLTVERDAAGNFMGCGIGAALTAPLPN